MESTITCILHTFENQYSFFNHVSFQRRFQVPWNEVYLITNIISEPVSLGALALWWIPWLPFLPCPVLTQEGLAFFGIHYGLWRPHGPVYNGWMSLELSQLWASFRNIYHLGKEESRGTVIQTTPFARSKLQIPYFTLTSYGGSVTGEPVHSSSRDHDKSFQSCLPL